jgi:hypothetical protein
MNWQLSVFSRRWEKNGEGAVRGPLAFLARHAVPLRFHLTIDYRALFIILILVIGLYLEFRILCFEFTQFTPGIPSPASRE